jgi:YbbR domain-containing protein
VRRVTDLILRNWPLKLGAVALATILYSGLVLGQNVRTWTGTLPVEAIRQPAGVAMLSELVPVTQVRYRAPLDVGVVSPETFRATVDLSRVEAQPGGPAESVPVTVIALDSRIQVVDYQPQEIPVQLDPVASREMPVTVFISSVPNDINTAPPQVDPSTVTITGASSRVDVVTEVIASVAIDASGLNVDREVDLVAVDSNGNQVPNVDIEPDRAQVRIAVARELANVTLPVVPQVVGVPAPGYRISSVIVEPLVVTVSGEESIVAQMQTAPTEAIDVADRTSDLEANVGFDLPEGVSVSGSDRARVVVTIEEETGTRTFTMGIVTEGDQPPSIYNLSTTQVQVTLGGPLAMLSAVDASTLTATVDVSALGGGVSTVPIEFVPPPNLEVLQLTPSELTVVRDEVPAAEPSPSLLASPAPSP